MLPICTNLKFLGNSWCNAHFECRLRNNSTSKWQKISWYISKLAWHFIRTFFINALFIKITWYLQEFTFVWSLCFQVYLNFNFQMSENISIEFLCSILLEGVSLYRISANSFLPWIFSPFNSFRNNYSIYEVKNCHNAKTI